MLHLSKIVEFFLKPFLPALVLIFVSIWLLYKNKISQARRTLIVAASILLIFSIPIFPERTAKYLEWKFATHTIKGYPEADAILVLGGTAVAAKFPRWEPEELGGSRLLPAARLFLAHKAPYIVVAGTGNYIGTRGERRRHTGDMKEILIQMGVPADKIIEEPNSANTREDIAMSSRLLTERGAKTALLITSAIHMNRAMAYAEKTSLTFIPVPIGHEIIDVPYGWNSFIPDAGALQFSARVAKECLGYLVAKMF